MATDDKIAKHAANYRRRLEELHASRRIAHVIDANPEEPVTFSERRRATKPPVTITMDLTLSEDEGELPSSHPTPFCTFPKVGRGITLYPGDMMCLADGRFINDNVVNLTLKWFVHKELLPVRRQRLLVCDSQLYQALTQPLTGTSPEEIKRAKLEKYRRVSKWFPTGDPFDHSLVCFPVCDASHWIVVLATVDRRQTPVNVNLLIMDSMAKIPRPGPISRLSRYVQERLPGVRLNVCNLAVRQQTNNYDCGLHTIHNVRRLIHHLNRDPEPLNTELEATLNQEPWPISRAELKEIIHELASEPNTSTDDAINKPVNCPTQLESSPTDAYTPPRGPASQADLIPTATAPERTIDPTTSDEDPVLIIAPESEVIWEGKTRLLNQTSVAWHLSKSDLRQVMIHAQGKRMPSNTPERRQRSFRRHIGGSVLWFRRTVCSGTCSVRRATPRPQV